MGDPSATAALDAYLERQSSFKSASTSSAGQHGHERSSTRPTRTDYENLPALWREGGSGNIADNARQPFRDSSQHARRHSSLGRMSDSKAQSADRLTDHASFQDAGYSDSGRKRPVWPPSPLDEKDETPLLAKLHPATTRSAGTAFGARKSSLSALQKLKRVPSTKDVAQQPAGYQGRSAGHSSPSLPSAADKQLMQQAAPALKGTDPTHRAARDSRASSAANTALQQDAVKGLYATAAAQPQPGRAGAQDNGEGRAPDLAPASGQATAPQVWRRARWDASLDAEDTRALDSLVLRQQPQPGAQPDAPSARPSTAGHNAAGTHLPQARHIAAGQPSAPSAAQEALHRSSAQAPAGATHAAASQGPLSQENEAEGAVSAASVLAEVLAELRAQEDSQKDVESPRSGARPSRDGAGGSAGAVLTKAALEEASALDAVVSWYRDVQLQQIDEGLAGDPLMFPLVRGNDASDLPAAQKRKAEQIWSPTGSTAAGSAPAKPGNGGGETSGILEGHRVPSASLPDSASKVQVRSWCTQKG